MPRASRPSQQGEQETIVRLLQLQPHSIERMMRLCGVANEHLRLIAKRLSVSIRHRGDKLQLSGDGERVAQAENVLHNLYEQAAMADLDADRIHLALLSSAAAKTADDDSDDSRAKVELRTPCLHIRAMSRAQAEYIKALKESDLSFGVGPAGVGKTWLAAAAAVEALTTGEIERIVLVRPAIEAGERLGFLPGDLSQKVEPYQKPLHYAISDFLGSDTTAQMMQRGTIEMLPLAYMRGRTLNNAFIVLDESQNATVEQMKMLLTRVGVGSKVAVTGDLSQSDLPRGTLSGLHHALRLLQGLPGVRIVRLDRDSVVRHPLVRLILNAYEKDEQNGDANSYSGEKEF